LTGEKLVGCSIIAAAIFWRILLLDNYLPKVIGDIYYEWALSLPFFSFGLSALIFIGLAISGKIRLVKEWEPFLGSILLWSFAGVGIAFIIIVSGTIYYDSPQGPLALILDGPLGVAVGIIVGLIFWLSNRKPDHSAS
jgi:hypothetical protein